MARVEKTVFISYRRTNAPWVLAIFQNLTQHGCDVFFDFQGIASGDFEGVILENIKSRAHFLVLLTPSALERCGEPGDLFRREIETALDTRRNIVPLVIEGFDFASPAISSQLTGKLEALKRYNALRVPIDYFAEAMDRLREKYLNVPLDMVLHAASKSAQQAVSNAQAAAGIAPAVIMAPSVEEKARSALERATKDHSWVNSLGMKFVPVAGTQVLFSVWDTRVQDFETFVKSTDYDATGRMWSLGKDGWKQRGATWREPGFGQGPTHPVVGVSWNDAKKFCEWLTRREQGSGMLPSGRIYRLPTDADWSAGVGLQGEEGTNPKEKDGKIELYPWGKKWPPPKGAGNYAGEESKIGEEPSDWAVIKGYNDGYPRTSPVGSFAANANGLYDMGGNVWQWCEDWYDATETGRVLRGASWNPYHRGNLLASFRNRNVPDYRRVNRGFRCVVGAESSR